MLLFIIPGTSANADMAPPPVTGVGGLEPFEYQSTAVQMVYERVEMVFDIQHNGDDPYYIVDVTAWFVMRNQSHSPEEMQAMFPLEDFNTCVNDPAHLSAPPSFSNFHIQSDSFTSEVDGKLSSITEISTDHPYKNIYKGGDGFCDYISMRWTAFDIAFPTHRDVLVRIDYQMDSHAGDSILNLQYILETGGAWFGPIETAYIILKFPFLVNEDFILSSTTPGYQTLQNEISWTFKNLEPSNGDNILISFVDLKLWSEIIQLKDQLSDNPHNSDAWIQLAENYRNIGDYGKGRITSERHLILVHNTFQNGIEFNPDNADLYAEYANFLYSQCYPTFQWVCNGERSVITNYVEKALSLNPSHEMAIFLKNQLEGIFQDINILVPPTFTPSSTSLPTATATPSSTPYLTTKSTLSPTHTQKTTTTPKITISPRSTNTFTPLYTDVTSAGPVDIDQEQNTSNLPIIVISVGTGFILLAAILYWQLINEKQS